MQITVICPNKGERILNAQKGERLLDVLTRNGIEIGAPCGGRCFCGKCRVRTEGAFSAMLSDEARFFAKEEIASGWRLACAARVEGDAVVTLPDEEGAKIATESTAAQIAADSGVTLSCAEIELPSLSDPRGDDARFLAHFPAGTTLSLSALRDLPECVRNGNVWAIMQNGVVTAVSNAPLRAVGVAFDIGTTTVAGYLMDLATGERLETASRLNPQRRFGADVISRADYAAQGLQEEADCVRGALAEMTREMLARQSLPEKCVCSYAVVGNTIMQHLFLGIPPRYISVTPFIPAYTGGFTVLAREVGLFPETAAVRMLPCVAGYVGADTVGAILSCDMDQEDGVSLLIDIGTNGEIALGGKDKMVCCSCAAGPAFEGAHIRCGMGAVTGAIDHVKRDGDRLTCTVIGDTAPKGLCGSGLVDAVAVLLDMAVIDETGRIDEDEADESILTEWDGKPAVILKDDIILCQKDIREVQLAKGAIAAGIEILMREMGVTARDIQTVYLAGGFGSFIDRESACKIGLLPDTLLSKIRSVGNAAGAGAQRALLSREAAERAERLRKRLQYMELSAIPSFQELFAEKMLFD